MNIRKRNPHFGEIVGCGYHLKLSFFKYIICKPQMNRFLKKPGSHRFVGAAMIDDSLKIRE
jgi:hypothetical protein